MNLSKKSLVFVMVASGILLLYKLYFEAWDIFAVLMQLPIILSSSETAAVGIIGGADGPSAIYTVGRLTGMFVPTLLVLALELALYVFLLVKAIKALRK